jgi:hypothetical protein
MLCAPLYYKFVLQRALKGMRDSPPKRCAATAAADSSNGGNSGSGGRPGTPVDATEKLKVYKPIYYIGHTTTNL